MDSDDIPWDYTVQNIPNHIIERLRPFDFFLLLFPEDMINTLVTQTNLYHNQEKEKYFSKHNKYSFSYKKWNPVDSDEIKTYLGLILLMGMITNKDYQGNLK